MSATTDEINMRNGDDNGGSEIQRDTPAELSEMTTGTRSEVDDTIRSLTPPYERTFKIKMRSMEEAEAQGRWNRFRLGWSGFWKKMFCRPRPKPGSSDYVETNQYRIPPKTERGNWWEDFGLITETSAVAYAIWHYKTTFVRSIAVFLIFYMLFAWFFAFILGLNVEVYYKYHGDNIECLPGWDYEKKRIVNFPLAFEVSWTTLSTVGFGVAAVPADSKCNSLRYILAAEAFIGVLFIGFAGAIIMAKISRLHSIARVIFSSSICLQFGDGISDSRFDVDDSEKIGNLDLDQSDEVMAKNGVSKNYPFIEFRIVNERSNETRGAIADASVRVMTTSISLVQQENEASGEFGDDDIDETDRMIEGINVTSFDESKNESRRRLDVPGNDEDEDDDGIAIQDVKRTYASLPVQPDFHPFFAKGGWYLRHTLNEKSPLLKQKVRKAIKSLGGWPTILNSHDAIRKCFNTDIFAIMVIFEGQSILTATSVFKTQVFKLQDIYIGWKFKSLSYVETTESKRETMFDLSLVHDIVPQDGGGEEPLGREEEEDNVVKFVQNAFTVSDDLAP